MIFSKKINILEIVCIVIFICVCMIKAHDVNRRFPNAKVVTNDETDYLEWAGCRIQALEKKIYTVAEFNNEYPENNEYKYLEYRNNEGYGIVVYTVAVTNCRDNTVNFYMPALAEAAAWPSTWHNGMSLLDGKTVIEPGCTQVIKTTAMYAPTLIHFTNQDKIRDNEFQLIFSYYPERVVLQFD